MNTDPNARVVLCFGDSNTFGQRPDGKGRYAANERWTGLLQQALGSNYYIIEEGLGGRTTDLDNPDPDKIGRSGFDYFVPCLSGHMPLDMVIIMLGTNDLKTRFQRSSHDVAAALRRYPEYIRDFCADQGIAVPKIVLVSPAYVDPRAIAIPVAQDVPSQYDDASVEKSYQLAEVIKDVAAQTGCQFMDVAPFTAAGADGLHLDNVSHQKIAAALTEILREDAKK